MKQSEQAVLSRKKYEKRSGRKVVSISFSSGEYKKILERTVQDGSLKKDQTKPVPSLFLKKVILSYFEDRSPVPETLTIELRSLRLEIRRIGTNINQALKLAQSLKGKKTMWGNPVNIEKELREVLYKAIELESKLEQFVSSSFERNVE